MKAELQGQYAGAVTRSVAFLIDLMIVAVTVAATSWLLSSTFNLIGINLTDCPATALRLGVIPRYICDATRLALAVYAALFAPIYAVFFWTFGGQTPGMAVMGIRVVRTDGKPMSFFRSIRRLIGFDLCLLTLGIGFLPILVSNDREGLHDKIAGTCVIYTWRGEQDVEMIENIREWARGRRQRGTEQKPAAN